MTFLKFVISVGADIAIAYPRHQKRSYATYIMKTFLLYPITFMSFFVICLFICNCEAEHLVCESLSLVSHSYCKVINKISIMMKVWFCVEVDVCLMLHIEADF